MRNLFIAAAFAVALSSSAAVADVNTSWGRTTCPEGYSPVFVGKVQPSSWTEFRCLPDVPENDLREKEYYKMSCVVCKRD